MALALEHLYSPSDHEIPNQVLQQFDALEWDGGEIRDEVLPETLPKSNDYQQQIIQLA